MAARASGHVCHETTGSVADAAAVAVESPRHAPRVFCSDLVPCSRIAKFNIVLCQGEGATVQKIWNSRVRIAVLSSRQ